MIPMGRTAPGRIAFDRTDVADRISAPDRIGFGQEEALVLAQQKACDMRADDPDEADRADEGYRHRGEGRDEDQCFQPQAADGNTHRGCPRLA